MTLTIVGLGPGEIDDLSRRAWRTLKEAMTVYLRTSQHNCVPCLPQTGAVYHSFDALYEKHEKFEDVYAAIVAQVMEAARAGDVRGGGLPGDRQLQRQPGRELLGRKAALIARPGGSCA